MTEPVRDLLARQLSTAWTLASHHLDGLADDDMAWRPSAGGLHVHWTGEGGWRIDWPDRETYDLGPPSIAWTTWHMIFWWSMAWDHAFGSAGLTREAVAWPGDAYAARLRIDELYEQWKRMLDASDDARLARTDLVRWPFEGRSLADLFAWANIELTKNAAELGYARFLKGED